MYFKINYLAYKSLMFCGVLMTVMSCRKACECYGDKYVRIIKKGPSGLLYNDSGWKFSKKEKVYDRNCKDNSDIEESSTIINEFGDRTITETEYRQIKCSDNPN